jgi:hypothetical protein
MLLILFLIVIFLLILLFDLGLVAALGQPGRRGLWTDGLGEWITPRIEQTN